MEEQPRKIEEKEFIVKAAIQIPDGTVFTGKEHSEISRKFEDELLDTYTKNINGFTTNKGNFVSREKAAEIAFKAGQTKELKNKLQSQDLNLK